MAQRPSFDLARLTTADKIVLGGSGLLFIDSFLRWQRQCGTFKLLHVTLCTINANEWGGNASFGGVLAALLTMALLTWKLADVTGVDLRLGPPAANIEAVLVLGAVFFTLLKFFLVAPDSPTYGAWIGLILALAIAYGGFMKMQERKVLRPPTSASGFGS
jgi:hypothetical protein